MDTRASGLKGDLATAAALALVLGIGWTLRDWTSLSAMRLPDTDDVMRLQQVRDWLGGQRFSDLAQHRLGAGVPMHWSRLADLGPAALIETIAPVASRHTAELAAVIAWPLMLFAAALALVARTARVAGGAGTARIAAVIAAVAYPATTIFLPGRIDHHGLQVVLLLGALLATIGPSTLRRGLIAGGCAAASMIVGLETAPLIGVLGAGAACCWAAGEPGAERRLAGWGAGALAGLIAGRMVFASDAFAFPACDGFTLDAWRAWVVAATGALALGIGGITAAFITVTPTSRRRPGLSLGTLGWRSPTPPTHPRDWTPAFAGEVPIRYGEAISRRERHYAGSPCSSSAEAFARPPSSRRRVASRHTAASIRCSSGCGCPMSARRSRCSLRRPRPRSVMPA